MVTFANLTFLYIFFVFGSFLGKSKSSPEVSYFFCHLNPWFLIASFLLKNQRDATITFEIRNLMALVL